MEQVSRTLIIAFSKGSHQAFEEIYETYSKQIYNISKYILKSEDWAEEIVQEAFLKLWLSREKVDPDQSLWSYLFVISKRLCFNKLRSIKNDRKAMEELVAAIAVFRMEEEMMTNEIRSLLDSSVNKLTNQQRLVWKMSREDGFSHKQIAQQLDISMNTVKNHLVQALKLLRIDFTRAEYLTFKDK